VAGLAGDWPALPDLVMSRMGGFDKGVASPGVAVTGVAGGPAGESAGFVAGDSAWDGSEEDDSDELLSSLSGMMRLGLPSRLAALSWVMIPGLGTAGGRVERKQVWTSSQNIVST